MGIRLERTRDAAEIARVLTHPRIYEWIGDDFQPAPENFVPQVAENIWHLLAYDGDELLGLLITHPINALLWEVHLAMLPNSWGARAAAAGAQYLAWLWECTGAEKLVGLIPSSNTLAQRFAQKLGMREAGRLTRCYARYGRLQDLVIFGLTRTS